MDGANPLRGINYCVCWPSAAFAVAAAVILSGCTRSLAPPEIPGEYVMQHDGVVCQLYLSADSTYVQEVRRSNTRERFTGAWEYDSRRGELSLQGPLVAFVNRADTEPSLTTYDGVVSLAASRRLSGEATLGADEGPMYFKTRLR